MAPRLGLFTRAAALQRLWYFFSRVMGNTKSPRPVTLSYSFSLNASLFCLSVAVLASSSRFSLGGLLVLIQGFSHQPICIEVLKVRCSGLSPIDRSLILPNLSSLTAPGWGGEGWGGGILVGCRSGNTHGDPALMPCSTCPE